MHSKEVKDTIDYWTTWAKENGSKNYDIAILKIWIKFERYLGDVFLNYSIGNKSETGYSPRLKLCFKDESQFNAFMLDGNKKYVEYINKIEKLSAFIFENNPFDIILEDFERKASFNQLKCIRNYIAHESEESRRKVITCCFGGKEDKFIEPNEFLKSKPKKGADTYYSIYINLILDVIEGINANID